MRGSGCECGENVRPVPAGLASIIDAVWGFDDDIENNPVDNYVRVLRVSMRSRSGSSDC